MGAAGALCWPAGGHGGGQLAAGPKAQAAAHAARAAGCGASLRLMLEQERMGLTELLCQCAHYAPTGPGGEQVSRRLLWVAHALAEEPLLGLGEAYAQACAQIPIRGKRRRSARPCAPCSCSWAAVPPPCGRRPPPRGLRRLRPLEEDARREAETGGGLVMRLGLLLGLMAGIALW